MQTKKDIKYRQKKTSNTNARKTLNADKKGHYLKTPCIILLLLKRVRAALVMAWAACYKSGVRWVRSNFFWSIP